MICMMLGLKRFLLKASLEEIPFEEVLLQGGPLKEIPFDGIPLEETPFRRFSSVVPRKGFPLKEIPLKETLWAIPCLPKKYYF